MVFTAYTAAETTSRKHAGQQEHSAFAIKMGKFSLKSSHQQLHFDRHVFVQQSEVLAQHVKAQAPIAERI